MDLGVVARVLLAATLFAGCGPSEASPDGGPLPPPLELLDSGLERRVCAYDAGWDAGTDAGADAGSEAGPDFVRDDGGADRCGRLSSHPPSPRVPACGEGSEVDLYEFWRRRAADGRHEGVVSAVEPESIAITVADWAVHIPWVGPDLRTGFSVGESVWLLSSHNADRIEGPRASAWRVTFSPRTRGEIRVGPQPFFIGGASCDRGGGRLCECGSGGWSWIDHALEIGCDGEALAGQESRVIGDWTVTNVGAPRVYFGGDCRSGVIEGEGYATWFRLR